MELKLGAASATGFSSLLGGGLILALDWLPHPIEGFVPNGFDKVGLLPKLGFEISGLASGFGCGGVSGFSELSSGSSLMTSFATCFVDNGSGEGSQEGDFLTSFLGTWMGSGSAIPWITASAS